MTTEPSPPGGQRSALPRAIAVAGARAAVLLLVLGSCAPDHGGAESIAPDDLVRGTVVAVTDGDSLRVDTSTGELEVRLAGVNAPEAGECHAEQARDFLGRRIEGREIGLDVVGIDQFDRTLAHVWLGGESVELMLVSDGHAIAMTPEPGDSLGGRITGAEDEAYRKEIGMWAADACGSSSPLPDLTVEVSSPDPPGRDDEHLDEEYATLTNEGAVVVDLGGWVLRDESSRNRLRFPPGTVIAPGDVIEVSSGCLPSPSWCSGSPIWNNDGDMALLLDDKGTVVARARY